MQTVVDDDSLEFFNTLSGRLRIVLDKPAKPASERVLNLIAAKDAKIVECELELTIDDRELTEDEWKRIVIRAPRIRMNSVDTPEIEVDHEAPDGKTFTVRDLARAIAKTEKDSREHGEWLGGVDVHHIFFEGIELDDDLWIIAWGS